MNDLEKRLTDLEIKFSFQEDFINQLNQIIIKQENKIDEIIEYLKDLKETSAKDGNNSSLKNEKPPHY